MNIKRIEATVCDIGNGAGVSSHVWEASVLSVVSLSRAFAQGYAVSLERMKNGC